MHELNFLMREYASRRAKNPRYSERAFAKAIGVSPGFLKLFFQGKRSLSASRAKEIADSLGWSELQSRAFLTGLGGKKAKASATTVSADRFTEISDWYHFAIVELLRISKPWTVDSIARALRISKTEVQFSLQLLQAHDLVEDKSGRFLPVPGDYVVPTTTSSAIRKFHRQTLEKAAVAVDGQTKEERDLRSLTLAFASGRKDEASAFIKKFVTAFDKKFSAGTKDSVYQLNLAFYKITGGEK